MSEPAVVPSGATEWLQAVVDGLAVAPLEEVFRRSDRLTPSIPQCDVRPAVVAMLGRLRTLDVAKSSMIEIEGEPGSLYLGATLHRCSWATVDTTITLRATELARAIMRPQLGPHAALAWRSAGLFYSKANDYVLANAYFEETADRLAKWARNEEVQDSYRALMQRRALSAPASALVGQETQLAEMHEETYEQFLLGRTGTAARTVEHTLTQWDGRGTAGRSEQEQDRERRLMLYRLYKTARRAIEYGEGSVERLAGLQTVATRTLKRLALPSWKRRPGVMTARSHLLAVPLCRVLRDLQVRHPVYGDAWDDAIDEHRDGFRSHYRSIVGPLTDETGKSVPADGDHLRELAQLRLTYALVFRNPEIDHGIESLDANVAADSDLSARNVDIERHTRWLREHRKDGVSSNANVIASVVCTPYSDALEGLPAGVTYGDFILGHPWLVRQASLDSPVAIELLERIAPGLRERRLHDARIGPV